MAHSPAVRSRALPAAAPTLKRGSSAFGLAEPKKALDGADQGVAVDLVAQPDLGVAAQFAAALEHLGDGRREVMPRCMPAATPGPQGAARLARAISGKRVSLSPPTPDIYPHPSPHIKSTLSDGETGLSRRTTRSFLFLSLTASRKLVAADLTDSDISLTVLNYSV